MEALQASVRAFVSVQGWTLIGEFSDVASGKDDRRPEFQAALARCRQLGAILVAARLDRITWITRRTRTLSQFLEDGISIRAAAMPGADDLMMHIYAAMAQKERELISARTKAALVAAKARGAVLGGDRGHRPSAGPDAAAAVRVRREGAQRAAHRLALEVGVLHPEVGSFGEKGPERDEIGPIGLIGGPEVRALTAGNVGLFPRAKAGRGRSLGDGWRKV